MSKPTLPQIIEIVGFDFDWAESKVWKLDVPIEEIHISELEWHFEIPFWDFMDDSYNLTPNQVLESPKKFAHEYNRILKSDLSYPIDIMENKGRWVILDGLHRLVKAKTLGHEIVKVRKIPRTKIDIIKK